MKEFKISPREALHMSTNSKESTPEKVEQKLIQQAGSSEKKNKLQEFFEGSFTGDMLKEPPKKIQHAEKFPSMMSELKIVDFLISVLPNSGIDFFNFYALGWDLWIYSILF